MFSWTKHFPSRSTTLGPPFSQKLYKSALFRYNSFCFLFSFLKLKAIFRAPKLITLVIFGTLFPSVKSKEVHPTATTYQFSFLWSFRTITVFRRTRPFHCHCKCVCVWMCQIRTPTKCECKVFKESLPVHKLLHQ